MKRDSIFYRLFQQTPSLLFDLLETPPANATEYRFDSVTVKEPKFEIDGVFLPPDTDNTGVLYFCEVQFQKDERLYERAYRALLNCEQVHRVYLNELNDCHNYGV
mgnify:CR=1 FL=1